MYVMCFISYIDEQHVHANEELDTVLVKNVECHLFDPCLRYILNKDNNKNTAHRIIQFVCLCIWKYNAHVVNTVNKSFISENSDVTVYVYERMCVFSSEIFIHV